MSVKIAFFCYFDSSIKATLPVMRAAEARGWETKAYFLHSKDGDALQHAYEMGFEGEAEFIEMHEVRKISCDIAHMVLPGHLSRRVCYELYKQPSRPLIVSGLVGLLSIGIHDCYYSRQACDFITVGSRQDQVHLQDIAERFGHDKDRILNTGLPIYDGMKAIEKTPHDGFNVVFAGQPTFPSNLAQRMYIVEQLIALARAKPEWNVILKPRHKPGQTTFHKVEFHFESLFNAVARDNNIPANFKIDYTPIGELFKTTDLCITISSTAGLEAITAGIPTMFLADFGVTEAYGNQYLINSGGFLTFDDLKQGSLPAIEASWKGYNLTMTGRAAEEIVNLLGEEIRYRAFDQNPLQKYGRYEDIIMNRREQKESSEQENDLGYAKRIVINLIRFGFRFVKRFAWGRKLLAVAIKIGRKELTV